MQTKDRPASCRSDKHDAHQNVVQHSNIGGTAKTTHLHIPRMTCGAPLITLKTVPVGPFNVPAVYLVAGSKGVKSSCSYLQVSVAVFTCWATEPHRGALLRGAHTAEVQLHLQHTRCTAQHVRTERGRSVS